MTELWRLTDEEKRYLDERGGNVAKSQEAKKQAYIKAGGIILNPDALDDLYEALKGVFDAQEMDGERVVVRTVPSSADVIRMRDALARAEGN